MKPIRRERLLRGDASLNAKGRTWIWYILPALMVYTVFMAYPMLDSVRLSFFEGAMGERVFVGWENYKKIFTDPEIARRFWNAFGNNWIFFGFHMLIQNSLGMLFAVILARSTMRGRSFYQTVVFLPCTIAVLVTGYLFKLLLNPVWSGKMLRGAGLAFLVQPWLGQHETALPVISLVSVWQWVGIPTMMFVAGLQGISEDLLEAAAMEGAGNWQSFFHIKLPLLRPVVGMIAILTFVSNFNAFDVIYAMASPDGSPDYATDIIGTLFYRYGIAGQHPIGIPQPGIGSAISTTIFVLLLFVVVPTLRKTQGKEF